MLIMHGRLTTFFQVFFKDSNIGFRSKTKSIFFNKSLFLPFFYCLFSNGMTSLVPLISTLEHKALVTWVVSPTTLTIAETLWWNEVAKATTALPSTKVPVLSNGELHLIKMHHWHLWSVLCLETMIEKHCWPTSWIVWALVGGLRIF